jgi:voltage-gated potassium channel
MTTPPPALRERLHALYFGDSPRATRFRFALVGLDLLTIGLFLLTSFVHDAWWIIPLDLAIAAFILAEFAARLYAAEHRWRHLLSLATVADVIVLASLLLPAFIENLGFLRVLRAVVLLRSRHLRDDLRRHSPWFRVNEDIIQRTVTLGVFIFIVTSAVYVTQHRTNPDIANYVDALYFTITTLTTTGFGDITLQGAGGRALAIIIMVVGVSLFLHLLRALIQPNKVRFECPDCGLLVHDVDAIHCKHCGRVLHIRSEGFA